MGVIRRIIIIVVVNDYPFPSKLKNNFFRILFFVFQAFIEIKGSVFILLCEVVIKIVSLN
jgi:hypothetical protein